MELDRSSVALFGSRLLVSLFGFLSTVYFARELGPTGLGVYFTFEALVNVVTVFSRFGTDSALEKRISEVGPGERGEFITGAFIVALAPVLVVSSLILLFSRPVNEYIGVAAVPLLVLAVLTGTSNSLFVGVLRGEQKLISSAVLELVGEGVRVGISVLLLIGGFGVGSLLYGVIASLVIRILFALLLVETSFEPPRIESVKSLASFSRYSVGVAVSGLSYGWTDTLLLAYLLSQYWVGIYEAAWNISVVTLLASQALGTAVFPSVSEWHALGELNKIENAFTEAVTYALLLVFPAIAGVIVLSGPIMRVIYQFQAGEIVLVVLVAEKLFQSVSQIASQVLLGINRPKLVFVGNAALVTANVSLNVLLIPPFGILGAAIATASTSVLIAGINLYYLRRFIGLNFAWRNHVWQAVGAVLVGVVVSGISQVVPPTTSVRILGIVAAGVITYVIVISINGEMRHRIYSSVS